MPPLSLGKVYGETAPVLPSAEMVVCFLAICLCNVRINSTPAHVFQKHPVGQGIDIVNSQSGAGAGIPGGSRNKEGSDGADRSLFSIRRMAE
mgnify:CR=1 FL=1